MDDLKETHVKLLAFDFLLLTPTATSNSSSAVSRGGATVSRAETVGIVTFRDHKPQKFLTFTIDDGTGCIPCILWLNHHNSPYFSRRNPVDVRLLASAAANFASLLQIGVLARVRGKITVFRGTIQLTVSDVVVERDPNAQILHWLQCIRLARKCYDVLIPSRKLT